MTIHKAVGSLLRRASQSLARFISVLAISYNGSQLTHPTRSKIITTRIARPITVNRLLKEKAYTAKMGYIMKRKL